LGGNGKRRRRFWGVRSNSLIQQPNSYGELTVSLLDGHAGK
jgi:hypothetical protein